MTLTLNYTYRIYPESKQQEMLCEWLEICRGSYNYALGELKDWRLSHIYGDKEILYFVGWVRRSVNFNENITSFYLRHNPPF